MTDAARDPFLRFRAAALGKQGETGETVRGAEEPFQDRVLTPSGPSHPTGEAVGETGETAGEVAAGTGLLTLSHRTGERPVRRSESANPSILQAGAPASHRLTRLTGEEGEVRASGSFEVPLPSEGEATEPEPLAPPAPRDLPEPPRPGEGPVILSADALAPVPGSPHAELEADWRASLARARERFAAHGGAPGGREAAKFVRDAATLECLLMTREREFDAWRESWRATLEGVYAGKVALLPGMTGDLLATWRAKVSTDAERVVCQRCGDAFERPADLPSHVPAQRCKACAEALQ